LSEYSWTTKNHMAILEGYKYLLYIPTQPKKHSFSFAPARETCNMSFDDSR
jgi:hypothetical protein